MAYFERERSALEPLALLRSVIDQALCVLDIGDETAPEEIAKHRQGAAIIAKTYGLESEAAAEIQRLDEFEQSLETAYREGEALPELDTTDPCSADTLKILWGLFSLTAVLEDDKERKEILDLAAYMMDFLDLEGRVVAVQCLAV